MKRFVPLVLFALLASVGLSQNEIDVYLEIYVVEEDGTLTPATRAAPGSTVQYEITAVNMTPDTLPPGTVDIVGPLPAGTQYVPNSATEGQEYELELEGDTDAPSALKWIYLEPLEPAESTTVSYRAYVDGPPTPESGSVNAFTQAMFGHIGVIEIACPWEPDPAYTCGEVRSDFDLFRASWDLYADFEGQVPVIPTPQTAWRLDSDGVYVREYSIGSRFYGVSFLPEGERQGFVVIFSP